jgi:phosphohistidine swiveling domain-containing protein
MNDRQLRIATSILANLTAAGFGATTALAFGLPWFAAIPATFLTGTLGWVVGTGLGLALTPWLQGLRHDPAGRSVYRLANLPPQEAPHAGGKGRSLAVLTQSGHPVPDGCVVLPRAFAGDDLTAPAAEALAGEVARLQRAGHRRFAVRSSAMAEDSANASFAGQFESVLDVTAEGVASAVSEVRRSRAGSRAQAYSAATAGVAVPEPDAAPELAVVVQAMVSADQAGVLFTVHPLTADLSTMLGNVVEGSGEALVSGARSAQEFTLSRPDGGYVGPAALRPFAARLHTEAHQAESAFDGTPLDIEWAVAAGKVWLLQARPITTLSGWDPVTAERNDSLTGNCLWSATNLSEANPEAQTPLTVSAVTYLQAHGGPSLALRGREMAGYIGGRPYANITVQIAARGKRAVKDPRATYREIAPWWGDLPSWVPIPVLPLTSGDWQREGLGLLRSLARFQSHRRHLPRFLAQHGSECARFTEQIAAAKTPEALRQLWTAELFDAALAAFWAVITSGSDSPARLEVELREQFGAEEASALMSNLAGLAGGLESLGPAAGLQEVLAGRMSREEYLDRFGHRGSNETELAWPRPAEDPHWLDGALAAMRGAADVTVAGERQRASYDEAMARLVERDPRLARRTQRRLLAAAMQAALRERVRSEGVRLTAVERAFALRAGELLGIADGVFFLTLPELLDALAGDRSHFAHLDVRRAAYQRYRQLPPLPGIIVGRFDPFAWAADPDRRQDVYLADDPGRRGEPERTGDDLITGFPGALGVVEGSVRYLHSLEESDQLRPGEVLVTHLTNIGWTPVFPRAAAIVTDLGAPLSHAAIVAREFGIPAVVGCGDATSRLPTGTRVRVDGGRGTVQVLAVAGPSADLETADRQSGHGHGA